MRSEAGEFPCELSDPCRRSSPDVDGRTLKWLKVKQPKYRELERGFYKPPSG